MSNKEKIPLGDEMVNLHPKKSAVPLGDWKAFPDTRFPGMTYRDYLIAHIAAGMATNCIVNDDIKDLQHEADKTIQFADLILQRMAKDPPF